MPGYRCPNCGTQLFGDGRLGQPFACACGQRIPATLADKARRYWIFQAALPYGAATLLAILALLHSELPADPWERFLSPILIAPSVASVAVVYRILMKRKRSSDSDAFLFRYYLSGMGLAVVSFVVALIAEHV